MVNSEWRTANRKKAVSNMKSFEFQVLSFERDVAIRFIKQYSRMNPTATIHYAQYASRNTSNEQLASER